FGVEVRDELHFDAPGVVGMARSTSPDSNGSQFFITLAAAAHLDGDYTVFGRVVGEEGLATLGRITRGAPAATPTRITTVTILASVP
ncbi:MAG: peptidylprolyl isomerase, partial [Polyangiales bacterium]